MAGRSSVNASLSAPVLVANPTQVKVQNYLHIDLLQS